jgi:hypothetical protein
VLTVVAAVVALALFAFWIRGSSVMAFLMIVPSFLLACAIWVQPMLTEPGFERLGSAHKWALFEAGAAGFFFAFLPCIVKWTREENAQKRAAKAAAAAQSGNLHLDAPFVEQGGSAGQLRG